MISQKQISERRQYTRFKVKDCSFALNTKYGPIIDISPDGLGFLYIHPETPRDTADTGMLFSETIQCCDPLPISKFWHRSTAGDSPILQRGGVQFGELTQEQYAQLESFILQGYKQDRKKMQPSYGELLAKINELERQVATTGQGEKEGGIMLICSHCKKIKNDRNTWQNFENYLGEKYGITFSHGICPECSKKFYPHVFDKDEK